VASAVAADRKQRTRGHVIADLAVNHVERHVLLAGHVVGRSQSDYGVDLTVLTFDANGEVDRGELNIQVKSTERVRVLARVAAATVRVERRDLRAWLADPLPFLLVLYDVSADRAFWIVVQDNLRAQRKAILARGSRWVTLRLPLANALSDQVIQDIVRRKRALMPRLLAESLK
jgi:Domain of unknown function (DUF4365)